LKLQRVSKKMPTYFMVCVCQISTDFNINRYTFTGINAEQKYVKSAHFT